MRILVTSTPGAGHVLPMVPVVQALQARGHDVVWATGADGAALVTRAGLRHLLAGVEVSPRNRQLRELRPDIDTLPPPDRRAVMFATLFGAISAGPMYDDLRRLATRERPDLVVHEPCEAAARPLALGLGVPAATVAFGRPVPPRVLAEAAAMPELVEVWADAGAAVPAGLGLTDGAYLHPLPDSLEPAPTAPGVVQARPVGYDGSDEPEPSPTLPDERSVYVTFGTEFGARAPWPALIEALVAVGARALLTTGGEVDPATLGPLPAGLRAERWVPQRRALAGARMVVSHGGSGAMLGAAAAGRPHLALPLGADQFDNADLLSSHPAGAALAPGHRDPGRLAEAIATLLDSDDASAAARALADEVAAMPSPTAAAAVLERLALDA